MASSKPSAAKRPFKDEVCPRAEPWRALTESLKQSSGKKGRELFHPLRLALTGRESGPEMAGLVRRMDLEAQFLDGWLKDHAG